MKRKIDFKADFCKVNRKLAFKITLKVDILKFNILLDSRQQEKSTFKIIN